MNCTIPILMYHSISDDFDKLSVHKRAFSKQMNLMKRLGYETINLSELNNSTNKKHFIITFDDGYTDVFKNAFPILQKLNYKATIFIVSELLSNINKWDQKKGNYKKKELMSNDQVMQLIKEGYEIGSHTLNHVDLTSANDFDAENQIYQSKINIEKRFNTKVYCFSYPYGSYNKNICNKVSKHYKFAVTTKRSRYKKNKFNNYTLPRVPINSNTGLFKFYIKVKTLYEDFKFVN